MLNIYLYLGIYVILLLIISYFIGRKQSSEDFLISGRNRSGWQIMASKFATAIGASYFITYTGFAYEYGLGVFAILVGIVSGYLLFAYWAAPKIHLNSKKGSFYTMGDFVYSKTRSKFASSVANNAGIVICFFWLLIGIVGGAKIIEDFGLLSYSMAVVLTISVVLVYILMAGFKAVIITDIIQAAVIVALLILVTVGIVGSGSVGNLLSSAGGSLDIMTAISFFLFGLLSHFSFPNLYQLCYASKSDKSLKHGLGFSIVPIIFVGFLLLLIGLFMALNAPSIDSGLVFTEALKNFLPASLLPIAIVLFFAGIMSSADTNIYTIASHHSIPKNGGSVYHIRKAILILILITTLVALVFNDVVDITILGAGISLTLSLPMLYLFLNGRSSKRFVRSFVFSLFGFIIGIAIWGINPSLAGTVILGGVLGLIGKKDNTVVC